MRPDLELYVDRLVLDGLPVGADEGERLRVAVEVELGRLLGENGLPQGMRAGADIESIDAGQVALRPFERPESVGGDVARAVYGGLSRGQ